MIVPGEPVVNYDRSVPGGSSFGHVYTTFADCNVLVFYDIEHQNIAVCECPKTYGIIGKTDGP